MPPSKLHLTHPNLLNHAKMALQIYKEDLKEQKQLLIKTDQNHQEPKKHDSAKMFSNQPFFQDNDDSEDTEMCYPADDGIIIETHEDTLMLDYN